MERELTQKAPPARQSHQGWSEGASGHSSSSLAAPGGAARHVAGLAPSMPIEGAVLYKKTIDNSGVRYRHDPKDRDALRKHVSWGLFVVFVLLLLSGPRLWVRHSGYRQAQLVDRIEQLVAVRDQLKVQRGRLEDLRRVAALAELGGLRETGADSYSWFAPRLVDEESEKAVARLFDTQD